MKNHYDKITQLRAGFYNKPFSLASRFQDEVLRMVPNMLGRAGGILLDVGCGRGRYIIPLSKAGFSYVGLDISHGMLKITKCNADPHHVTSLVQSTVELLPFKDESFDCVVCVDLLHHLINRSTREETLRELARVVKSDGQIVIEIKNKLNVIYWLLSKCNPSPVAQTVLLSEVILLLKTLGFNTIRTRGVMFPIVALSPLVLISASRHKQHVMREKEVR